MSAITVKQLIEGLKEFPQDAIVVLSKDGEGNSFSPIPDDGFYSTGKYSPDSTWSGEFTSDESIKEDEDAYVAENAQDCVVLWPTN